MQFSRSKPFELPGDGLSCIARARHLAVLTAAGTVFRLIGESYAVTGVECDRRCICHASCALCGSPLRVRNCRPEPHFRRFWNDGFGSNCDLQRPLNHCRLSARMKTFGAECPESIRNRTFRRGWVKVVFVRRSVETTAISRHSALPPARIDSLAVRR